MNIDRFMIKHSRHSDACWTVHWFLNGRVRLEEAVRIAVVMHQSSIKENIFKNNPLFEMLVKNKAA